MDFGSLIIIILPNYLMDSMQPIIRKLYVYNKHIRRFLKVKGRHVYL